MGCCDSKNIKVEDVNETAIRKIEVEESSNGKAIISDDKKPNESNIRNMKSESNNEPSIEPKIVQDIRSNNESIKGSDNEQDNKSTELDYNSSIVIVRKRKIRKIRIGFDSNSTVVSDIEEENMSTENDESESEQIFNSEDEEEKYDSRSLSIHSSSSDDSDPSPFQGNEHLSMFKNKRFTLND